MWWWILIWAVLLLAAAAALGLLGWRLFRQVLALGREVGASGGRASAALADFDRHATAPTTTSVFLDPKPLPAVQPRPRRSRR